KSRNETNATNERHAGPACSGWCSERDHCSSECNEGAGDRGIAPQTWRNAGGEVLRRCTSGSHGHVPGPGEKGKIGSGIVPDSGRVPTEIEVFFPANRPPSKT